MVFKHLIVTLTGSSQPLTTNKAIVGAAVMLQAGEANNGAIFVGGLDSTATQVVTSSDYAIRIPPPNAAGDPAPPLPFTPWDLGIKIPLNQIMVIGTEADTLAVGYWEK